MFLDIVKLGVRFLPEKSEGRFYVAKNRLYSHHLSFCAISPVSSCRACTSRYLPGKYSERRSSELCVIAVIVRQNRKDQIRSFIEK